MYSTKKKNRRPALIVRTYISNVGNQNRNKLQMEHLVQSKAVSQSAGEAQQANQSSACAEIAAR